MPSSLRAARERCPCGAWVSLPICASEKPSSFASRSASRVERHAPALQRSCISTTGSIARRNHRSILRQLVDLVDAHAVAQRLRDGEDAAAASALRELVVDVVERERVRVEAPHADVEHAQRLLDDLGEGAPDGHHLADALHLAADAHRRAAELAEVPARDLADDVVERGLEEGRRAARDGVGDLGQRVAERDLGRDVGQRIAGGLARERRRARQPRVDLDDAVVARSAGRARTGCCTRRRCRGGGSS